MSGHDLGILMLLLSAGALGVILMILALREDFALQVEREEQHQKRQLPEEACRYMIVTPTGRHYYTDVITRLDCGVSFVDVHDPKRVELHGTFTVTDRGYRPADAAAG